MADPTKYTEAWQNANEDEAYQPYKKNLQQIADAMAGPRGPVWGGGAMKVALEGKIRSNVNKEKRRRQRKVTRTTKVTENG